jgi:hypothetical protein
MGCVTGIGTTMGDAGMTKASWGESEGYGFVTGYVGTLVNKIGDPG